MALTYQQIYPRVRDKIRDIKHDDKLTVLADTTLESLGFDANGLAGLAVDISNEFNIVISLDDAAEWEKVRNIATTVNSDDNAK